MNNEKGFALVGVLLVLALATIIGIAALTTSNMERKTAAAFYVYEKNFNSADSGIEIAPLWAAKNQAPTDYTVDWVAPVRFEVGDGIANVTIRNIVRDGKVLLYGDPDGDFLWEENEIDGRPFLTVTSEGSIGKGRTAITATFRPMPLFPMPRAALTVHSSVNGNGVSGQIVGEGPSDSSLMGKSYYDSSYNLSAVPDIMHHMALSNISYGGNLGANSKIVTAPGFYPYSLVRSNIKKRATVVKSLPGNKFPVGTNLTNNIVFVEVGSAKISQNIVGSGILVVDGELEVSGNFQWEGFVLVNGHLTMNGGGNNNSTMVQGAVVAMGDAIALNGSVDIIYNGNILSQLDQKYFRYERLTWREHM